VYEKPTIADYNLLARLSESFNSFATFIPLALFLCSLAELNGVMRPWVHAFYLVLAAGTLLSVEAGVAGTEHDVFNLGRREVGLYMVWGVIVATGMASAGMRLFG
ncbi:hypothetical protein BC938DRAFT_480696, partial [Jimgerdemannia flammicorona]